MTTETQVSKCQQHKDCLAVVSAKGALVTSSGTAILTDLPALVTATPSTDGQAVVLGTLSATGPASLFDTAVGKVRFSEVAVLLRFLLWCVSWRRLKSASTQIYLGATVFCVCLRDTPLQAVLEHPHPASDPRRHCLPGVLAVVLQAFPGALPHKHLVDDPCLVRMKRFQCLLRSSLPWHDPASLW